MIIMAISYIDDQINDERKSSFIEMENLSISPHFFITNNADDSQVGSF